MFCNNCGKEIPDGSAVCNYCGFRFQSGAPQYPAANDGPIGGLGIICFLVPIVGLILYLVWKDSTPMKAKGAGKAALWGVGVSVALSAIMMVIALVAGAGAY